MFQRTCLAICSLRSPRYSRRGTGPSAPTTLTSQRYPPAGGSIRPAPEVADVETPHIPAGLHPAGDEGRGRRRHLPHGPQAFNSQKGPDQNPHGVHGEPGSGVPLLASKDARLQPAPRLPRSQWPDVRAEPAAPLKPYARGVCARRPATKYRNTTTATRHPAGLGAVSYTHLRAHETDSYLVC